MPGKKIKWSELNAKDPTKQQNMSRQDVARFSVDEKQKMHPCKDFGITYAPVQRSAVLH